MIRSVIIGDETKVREFFQQYRKFLVPAALMLVLLLAVASRHDFGTESGIPLSSVDQPSAVEIVTKKPPTGIERSGYVGTPVLLPIHSGFAGRVSEVYVQEGQAVKAGQPLFKLEAASVGAATAGPATDENAANDYNRLQKLYEQGIISRRELENAAASKGASQNLSNRQSSTATTAIVTAPIEGIVTALAAAAGNTVQSDQRILSLGSGQTFEVVVPLAQEDLYWVQLGMPATIEISGDTITGQVASIFPEVKDNVLSSFRAHIQLANPPAGSLQIGMAVTVRFDTGP
jgi:membrane fusion protein, multidrug efflux system